MNGLRRMLALSRCYTLKLVCNGVANKFHKVVLHGETLVFVTTTIVAEVESGSTFGETCLATEVQNVSRNNGFKCSRAT